MTDTTRPILVIDDDWYFCKLLSDLLEREGYCVRVVRNARDATVVMRKEHPSLAIVDYHLGRNDGSAWIAEMREQGFTTPMILLSGFPFDHRTFNHMRNVLRVSMILNKPIDPEQFLEHIGAILTRETSSRTGIEMPEQSLEHSLETQSSNLGVFLSASASRTREDAAESRRRLAGLRRAQSQSPSTSQSQPPVSSNIDADRAEPGDRRAHLWNEPIIVSDRVYLTPASDIDKLESVASEHEEALKSGQELLSEYDYSRLCAWILQAPFERGHADSADKQAGNGESPATNAQTDSGESLASTKPRADSGEALDAPETASVEEVIEQLRQEYWRELPREVFRFCELLREIGRKGDPREVIEHAASEAHRLKGTTGSYGLSEVSSMLHLIELTVAQYSLTHRREWMQALNGLAKALTRISGASRIGATTGQEPAARLLNVLYVGKGNPPDDCGHYRFLRADRTESAVAKLKYVDLSALLIDLDTIPMPLALEVSAVTRLFPGFESGPLGFVAPEGRSPTWDEAAILHAGGSVVFTRPFAGPSFSSSLDRLTGRFEPACRILVMDDDESFLLEVAEKARRQPRLIVKAASHGTGFFGSLQRFCPDVAFLGGSAEGTNLDGFEICRMLRASDKWKELKVVLIEKHSSDSEVAALDAGADDFLTKPLRAEEVLSRAQSLADVRHHFALITSPARLMDRLSHAIAVESAENSSSSILTVCLFETSPERESGLNHMLAEIEALMVSRFRVQDLRAIWPNDSFVIACPGQSSSVVEQSVRLLLNEAARATNDRLSVRMACVEFPGDGITAESLIHLVASRLVRDSFTVDGTKGQEAKASATTKKAKSKRR